MLENFRRIIVYVGSFLMHLKDILMVTHYDSDGRSYILNISVLFIYILFIYIRNLILILHVNHLFDS
jgi:hypothetical protein